MKKVVPAIFIYIIAVTLMGAFSAAATAGQPDVAYSQPPPAEETGTVAEETAAADPESHDYQPVEKAADDTSMALIASGVFGLPIIGWLIFRSIRKNKKDS